MRKPVVCVSDVEYRQEQHLVRTRILCCKCSVCCLDASTSSELVCRFSCEKVQQAANKANAHTRVAPGSHPCHYIFISERPQKTSSCATAAASFLCLAPISCVLLLSCLRAGQVMDFIVRLSRTKRRSLRLN